MKEIYFLVFIVVINFGCTQQIPINVPLKAKDGQFPLFGLLQMWLQWPSSDNATYCGASLISWKHILTAAHCFYHDADVNKIKQLCKSNRLRVFVGQALTRYSFYDRNSKDNGIGYLENIIAHDKYKNSRNYDIAVGILSTTFDHFDPFIQTIVLPPFISNNGDSKIRKVAHITGMGKGEDDDKSPSASVIYANIIKLIKSKDPVVFMPVVSEISKRNNWGGPLICPVPRTYPVQYGVVMNSGKAVLVERMMDFIEMVAGNDIRVIFPPHWRTNKTTDDKIGKMKGSSGIEKVTFTVLICEMIVMIVK